MVGMSVELARRLEMPAPRAADATSNDRATYTAIAIYDGHQWSSLCPELDVASLGGHSDEANQNVVDAVKEALRLAADEDLSPGSRNPDDELRRFMVSSQAPFHVARFYA